MIGYLLVHAEGLTFISWHSSFAFDLSSFRSSEIISSEMVKLLCWGISLLAALIAMMTYALALNLKNRADRIEQKSE